MTERDDLRYRAVLARDYRFDGKFFVGVKTTGVYCRPICPARPKRENIEFFPTALSAERAGYRPCLRCRPESAPLSPAWVGTSAVVQRALRHIAAQPGAAAGEDEFAGLFGLSARHLRRLFEQELGKTPKQICDAIRLDFARKLIVETRVPITEIAFTAGFRSLRRFNDAVQVRFRRPPTEIRKRRRESASSPGIVLGLSYRPPLDWEALLDFYRGHRIEGVESASGTAYERTFLLDGVAGLARVTHAPDKPELRLRVVANDHRCLFPLVQTVRRMFDLDSDPVLVANALSLCPVLSRLYKRRPGLRIARGWNAFEVAVCAILGQLVSTTHARRLCRALVQHYGERGVHPLTGETCRHFPDAARLAHARLTELGVTRAKREAIRVFAERVASGELSLSPAQDPAEFKARLRQIPGIGSWTAEYIALRALGDVDAFPMDDLILKRAVALHPEMNLEATRPWRGYAAVHLWRQYAGPLSGKGRTAASARAPRRGKQTLLAKAAERKR